MVPLLGLLFDEEQDFRPNPERQAAGLEMILEHPEKGQLLVSKEGDRVTGMVNLLFTISTAEGGKVMILEDLVVHPDFRKQGIGQALLAAAVDLAKREGCLRITLATDRINARAQALYGRFGFKLSAMTLMRLNFNHD
jgi:GNAT superfamily N-acetyltransferase